MKLTKGNTYDVTKFRVVGWTSGDGSSAEGYRLEDYFSNGRYLGPDVHGIEPEIEWDTERDERIADLRNRVAALQSMVGSLGNSELEDVYDVFLTTIKGTCESAVRIADRLIELHNGADGAAQS